MRDHLFVSHASEDDPFAEWLTLKLTSEGYKVWCDHIKLLGGESYPKDIDEAIKSQTFRFLALISRNSLLKPNPLKERTLALNLGRERNENFVIPLNIDGLKPTEIDWMTSDITFIPFHGRWFAGLEQLLMNLSKAGAPRTATNGRMAVREWYLQQDVVEAKPETIWSNLIPILEIPRFVYRFEYKKPTEIDEDQLLGRWPFYLQDATTAWSFQRPAPPVSDSVAEVRRFEWREEGEINGMRTIDLLTAVTRRSMEHLCLRKGLMRSFDGRHLYFGSGTTPNDRLWVAKPTGSREFVKSVGVARYWIRVGGDKRRETSNHHLSPQFKPFFGRFGQPVIAMRIYIFWTDTLGNPRPSRKAFRLRRRLARGWYNSHWFRRQKAILGWLTDWNSEFAVITTQDGSLKIGGEPLSTISPVTINEHALAQYATNVGKH